MNARKRTDITGKRYGMLAVIERAGTVRGRSRWLVRCDCGTELVLSRVRFANAGKSSCGCRALAANTVSEVWRRYKRQAAERGFEFNLSKEQVEQIIFRNCSYCLCPPMNRHEPAAKPYNGIDRVDSSLGYEMENVTPCCAQCNRAKSNYALADFFKWVDAVHSHSVRDRDS